MKMPGALKVGGHIVVWLLFFTLMLSVSTSMGNTTFTKQLFSLNFCVFCCVYLFIFYINSKVFFPGLYLHKKYVLYFSAIFAMLFAVYLLTPFDNLLVNNVNVREPRPTAFPPQGGIWPPPLLHPHGGERIGSRPFADITSLILFLLVWLASVALQILKEWRSSEQRTLIAESDKKTAELAFLKAHINPHFLFNTLNNIYSLAITGHEQTAVSILKLSNIMRYITESAATDFISLESEVECIVDYIDLQKLRLSNKVYLDFSITGIAQDKMIAPLLLLTFIENIFKYGISNHHQATIIIKLFIEEKTITFYSQNRIFNPGYIYDREGFGVTNTKQRLEFLYPGKHFLDINTNKGLYTVQLTLQI